MRSYYKGVARDQYGAIIGGATIAIYLAGTTTVASVYTVSIGGTAVNSVTADIEGVFYFYVDTSDYSNIQLFKLVISYLGNTTTYDNISAFYYDNYYIDALGEYGSGTAYTQSTIEAALTAIGTTNKATMLLRPGTWAVTADLTIPANVTLKIPAGAVLSIATGKTLTINGPFEAGLYQVFDCSDLTSKVIFAQSTVLGVYPEWWGAKGDEITDDTIPCQLAVNSCIPSSTSYPHKLILSGMYKLTAPVNIDRDWFAYYLDTGVVKYGEFYIEGIGGSGFIVDTAIKMFGSNLIHTDPDVAGSLFFRFNKVLFKSNDAALSAYVLDDNFWFVRFQDCEFYKIKCLNATRTVLAIEFLNCYVSYWSGTFFKILDVLGGTCITVDKCVFNKGDIGFYNGPVPLNMRFTNNVYEQSTGPALRLVGPRACVIQGNYFEGICLEKTGTPPTYVNKYYVDLLYDDVSYPTVAPEGNIISGNWFMMEANQYKDISMYGINLQRGSGNIVSGNNSNTPRLYHDGISKIGGVTSTGNAYYNAISGVMSVDKGTEELISGIDRVSNGNFTSAENWTLGDANVSITGGKAVWVNGQLTSILSQACMPNLHSDHRVGRSYKVSLDVDSISGDDLLVTITHYWIAGAEEVKKISKPGHYEFILRNDSGLGVLNILPWNGTNLNATIDNVKIEEIPLTIYGSHNSCPGTIGGISHRCVEVVHSITADVTNIINTYIPTVCRILGVQMRVDTALTAGETWTATLNDGADIGTICTAAAVAKNTKVDYMVDLITDATTNINIVKSGGGAFTAAGVIRVILYYEVFMKLYDAP